MSLSDVRLSEVFRDLAQIPFGRIAAIVVLAWVSIRLLGWLLPRVADALPARFRLYVLPWVPALRLLITFVAVLWIVPLVIAPTPQNLFALLGALGIALGFAFKDFVSSLVAGVIAVYERPYRQGDWVRIRGVYGEVVAVGLRAVYLRTLEDERVSVPHAALWTEAVGNANDGVRTLMVVTTFWLAPDHDAAAARERLREVAWTSAWLDATRPVTVEVDESKVGTRYQVKAYPLDARDQRTFRTDVTVRGKQALRDAGCRFATVPVAQADA